MEFEKHGKTSEQALYPEVGELRRKNPQSQI
jgi:hypothetical protein